MASVQAKAWLYTSAKGGAENNLRLSEYSVPETKPDHILIEVLNTSLNPGDCKLAAMALARPFITLPASMCYDFCGRIRALPAGFKNDSRDLHVGQIVFGMHLNRKNLGTLKTIMWVHQDSVYPLPDTIPTEHGSALSVGALTAYQAIAQHAKPNAKILITGGSGGVGTFGIQVAKALGMYVIATCSERGAQLCKDLGADEILDYTSATFLDDLNRLRVDLIVDAVGNDPHLHKRSEVFLKPDGQFVLVALMGRDWAGIQSMLVSWLCPTWLGGPPRKWRCMFAQGNLSDLEPVAKLAKEGKLKVAVDTVFPFGDVPRAYEKLKSGRAKGKIIVDITARDV